MATTGMPVPRARPISSTALRIGSRSAPRAPVPSSASTITDAFSIPWPKTATSRATGAWILSIPSSPAMRSQFLADVAFVANNPQFTFANEEDTGFQHVDIGMIGRYNLNTLFNISRRYGTFHLEGYLYYTDGIDNDLLADTQLWGGVGIGFRY